MRKMCTAHFLSYVRLREWEDIHAQLLDLLRSMEFRFNPKDASPDQVHRALLAGLLSNIGNKTDTGEYAAGRAVKFHIHPGSTLYKSGQKWVMAGELVQTTKLYARTLAPISVEWIEEIGKHLLKRSHWDPHWSRPSGKVLAYERVTLFGLEIVAGRRVHYGPIDHKVSREIFIQSALVEGDMDTKGPFLAHNKTIEDQIRSMEVRTRKNTLLAALERLFTFYDRKIPQDIITTPAFEKWRSDEIKRNPRLLFMTREDMLADGAEWPSIRDFPDELDCGPVTLPLSYVLEPGAASDGVTVRIPVETLAQLNPERFTWLIPGHLREKIETIVRGLPKEYRRILPAAGALAAKCAETLKFGDGNLYDRLREVIRQATTVDVPRETLASIQVPEWMRMRFEVFGDNNKSIAVGRDLSEIKQALAPQLKGGLLKADKRFHRDDVKTWDFGDLPERIEIDRMGLGLPAFPGIVDQKTSVSLRLFDSFESSQIATRAGSRRLFMFDAAEPLRRHAGYIPGIEKLAQQYATLGNAADLRQLVLELIADRAFIGDQLPVRTEREFAFRTSVGIGRIAPAVQEAVPVLQQTLTLYQQCAFAINTNKATAFGDNIHDMRTQLAKLMPKDFLISTPWEWLRHYPRYLQAILLRITKLPSGGAQRDTKLMLEIQPLYKGYEELRARQKDLGLNEAKIVEFRWLLEELRVSFFAQELRTSVPVSVKRMHELWEAIVRV